MLQDDQDINVQNSAVMHLQHIKRKHLTSLKLRSWILQIIDSGNVLAIIIIYTVSIHGCDTSSRLPLDENIVLEIVI